MSVARPCKRSLAELHLCARDDAANLIHQRPLDRRGRREQTRDDRQVTCSHDDVGVTGKLPKLLLHSGGAVRLVRHEV